MSPLNRVRLTVVLFLLLLFTGVEFLTLYLWLQLGNSPGGLSILLIGLLVEHGISLLAGVIAGALITGDTLKKVVEFLQVHEHEQSSK